MKTPFLKLGFIQKFCYTLAAIFAFYFIADFRQGINNDWFGWFIAFVVVTLLLSIGFLARIVGEVLAVIWTTFKDFGVPKDK